jgi:hypothetical protein
MTIHSSLASRVLTGGFYLVNAMFFLVVMAFCFGFMRANEHVALAQYFVSSIWLVLIPIAVWVLYAIKVVLYNTREIREEKNRFLMTLPLLPFSQKATTCTIVSCGQLAPAIAYGLFLVLVGSSPEQWPIVVVILLSLGLLIVGVAWRLHHTLVYPEKEVTTAKPSRWLDRNLVKPAPWMYVQGVIRLRPGSMYVTKIVSCLVIYGATNLYLYDSYDARLYSMAACVAFSANLVLVHLYQIFEVVVLSVTRTLPLSFFTRTKWLVISMIVLCLPEIAILATNLPDAVGIRHYFYVIAFGISLFVFAYGALYVRFADFEAFTRWIFFVSMGWIVLILFGVPLIAGAAIHVVLGVYLLKKYFYSFEVA